MKWWEPHTNKLKYFSYEHFDEHNNKFGIGWSPGSELMLGTNISNIIALKNDLWDHPWIKDYVFEVNANFPPRGTSIGIIAKYC